MSFPHRLIVAVATMILSAPALAQLRVVTYNTNGGPRADSDTVLEEIGLETVNGFAKPIDVLTLQEQTTLAGTTQGYLDLLNGIYGAGTYARGTLQGRHARSGTTGDHLQHQHRPTTE